jgi:hypothetical protein
MRISRIVLAAALTAACGAFAAEAAPMTDQGTVNSYTQAQEAHARREVINAGYRPTALQFVQDGNFFFNATRGADIYSVTVTSAGKVYASSPLPKSQS